MKKKVLNKMLGFMLGGVILFSSNVTALAAITSSSTSPAKGTNQSDYSSFEVTNGYGRIAGGDFDITKGATSDLYVNVSVKSDTTEKDLKNFIKNNKSLFNDKQYSQIISLSAYTTEGRGAELLQKMLSIVFGDYYQNVSNQKGTAANDKQEKLLKELYKLPAADCILKGTQTAVGMSYIPTTPYCYVQSSKLTFSDGRTVKVVNTTTTIGDVNGSTSKVSSSSKNEDLQLILK